MPRTREMPPSRRFRSVGLLIGLACTAAQATAASLAVTVLRSDGKPLPGAVLRSDGKPLPGAVLTAEAESQHLPPAPPVHAIVDQVDLAFVPDVSVIPVGSTLSFPNSDGVSHQVYSF